MFYYSEKTFFLLLLHLLFFNLNTSMAQNQNTLFPQVTSVQNARHYKWGNQCDGWHLLESGSLSVIQEQMPAGTSEKYHYHSQAQQVFYILQGKAKFIIEDKEVEVSAGESLHIPAKIKHKIFNNTLEVLQFLVISQPKAQGDRVDLD